ncbi:unnamed protein product [Arctia plantaginis]|uniref:PHD-type domain-containing protein n=1 Tax=Arctia plantaginis TaxID=874455 RepID=A0A8S0ZUP4_ARCPL|nr:unnamed protein product [Arctia plantaginis]
MATKYVEWGCCAKDNETDENLVDEKFIKCTSCGKSYHYACLSVTESPNKSWKCPTCLSCAPKVNRKDSTPIRNVQMNRGNKRVAIGSPSPPPIASNKDEIRTMIRDIIKTEFNLILTQFNKTVVSTINQEMEPIRKEIQEVVASMSFMNDRFEAFEKSQQFTVEVIKNLESENKELKNTVGELLARLNQLEQQSRSNNIEIQNMPENKNENIYNIINDLGQVVSCEIKEKEILHCTRIAKVNPSSTRPSGFSVVAPEVAVPGKTTAILVTLHGRAGDTNLDPLNVTVRLETQDADNDVKLLTTASQMITGTCL